MVTAPEGYTALDRGTIDTFGLGYTYAHGAYKLYEVSKYVTDGINMTGFMCFQAVNIDAWRATPAPVRDALPMAQSEAIAAMIKAYKEAGANKIWEEWANEQTNKGHPAHEILEFVKSVVTKYSN